MKKYFKFIAALVLFMSLPLSQLAFSQSVMSPSDLLSLERCGISELSPDGSELIYSISTPRTANEEAGGSHYKYYKMNMTTQESTLLFEEGFKGGSPHYSPDGSHLAFTYTEEGGKSQVWVMPVEGGEKIQVTHAENGVSSYQWQPDGLGMAYLSMQVKSEKEMELDDRGYGFIFYEENLKIKELYLVQFDANYQTQEEKKLLENTHVWEMIFSPSSEYLAFTTTEKNLTDQKYMFRKIKIMDLASGKLINEVGNIGKLGNYAFNEEGTQLAFASALNINDHAVSQAFVYSLKKEEITNLTPENFKGHVSWIAWKSNKEIFFYSGEGVYPKLSSVSIKKGKRDVLLDAEDSGIIFGKPIFTADLKTFVFTGNTPSDYSNIYSWSGKGKLNKLTNVNPQLADMELGEQEVIQFIARDGKEIEGLLMKPVGYKKNKKYPLVLYVHGGPESHHSNGWLSRYSTPGQVMAGKGYLVAYLNYRASTGYGIDFAMEGFMDPAGKEFDDLADGIEYLIAEKGADKERVGMAGGSYGGYASGWFATYYTEYVKAVCMFVGISNVSSKRGTTDISYEELYVHSGKPLEEQWQMNLERSPVYWAHQSKTATLIYGGADDPRVHPEQSLQLYRRMKMNNHPAVRLVQYPGEGHGNRKQVGQIDVIYRQIDWLDWYVKDLKPLDGPMPALDISEKYGLDWEF
ncbi:MULTISPECIES: prolyl oligopeptidase family serine peptidase [unclassified Lentimicrobium]|uniref:S9 family peptidase n=1 Tax=unclassified Lentimicrobium TaxID=2677434 RepID=UPI001557C9F4|nr:MULTISPECIES: prolyl oligopeptidase family serine peptidase [unclassified Lentimicrobium]NPD43952.1 S9 family peptidase [Lentimicrobium sp. S6]NPD84167.1 S9 family peptidase [Lentimicrobium sp. L6]